MKARLQRIRGTSPCLSCNQHCKNCGQHRGFIGEKGYVLCACHWRRKSKAASPDSIDSRHLPNGSEATPCKWASLSARFFSEKNLLFPEEKDIVWTFFGRTEA